MGQFILGLLALAVVVAVAIPALIGIGIVGYLAISFLGAV